MAAIYLIRHGQASFGKADYDQLSGKGAKQAQRLGEFWRTLTAPDKMLSGDLLRHQQTLENFLIGYQGNKPSTVLHSGFNEFNHVDMLTRFDSRWKSFAHMASLISKVPDGNKVFQKEFAQALNRWVEGKHDSEYLESWPMFKKRCIAALYDVINYELAAKKLSSKAEPSNDICIFTSGGTISVIIQHILDLTDKNTLAVNQQLRNTGVTKLLFSDNRLGIDYLNNYAHLADKPADWVTFR